jgi:hypothetical protein
MLMFPVTIPDSFDNVTGSNQVLLTPVTKAQECLNGYSRETVADEV